MMRQAFLLLAVAAVLPFLIEKSLFLTIVDALYPFGVALMEDTRIPDSVLDFFLRPALRMGYTALVMEQETHFQLQMDSQAAFVAERHRLPIALFTGDANEQHYEVETHFFDIALGARKKYSAGLWPASTSVDAAGGVMLEEAEDSMLDLYVKRAGVMDGQVIIDLGCGWGSVTLYLAERFPNARIISISNSRTQKKYILDQASQKGFKNVDVHTLNVAGEPFQEFLKSIQGQVDRIISVEMFEHMKNYGKLLHLLSGALKPHGKLFVHIFCHKYLSYDFKDDDLNSWMTQNFFKGGTMPSQFLLQSFQEDLTLVKQWNVNGRNYTLTLEGWLKRMDAKPKELLAVFKGSGQTEDAAVQVRRWRIFMLACAEFFAFRGGTEFFVTHLLFEKRGK
jgi:cyclopropane-fatty-acyl-phospholipid synthase